jgi:methionine synthase I (cobalamin-dependent)
MHATLEKILASTPAVTDGAWGTQLQARGLESGACPEAWNTAHPERVEEVAALYVEAGSDVILTNTFGGSRITLAGHGLADRAAELNLAGAEISRRAAAGKARVFGSIGPCGKLILMGDVTPDEVAEAFTEQAVALAAGGVDGIVVETMADLEEAVIAVQAARQTGLPVVACMAYDAGPDNCNTMMGVTPEQAAEGLAGAGADAIGANCGQPIDAYPVLARRLRAATDLPLWFKPNAGVPRIVDGKTVYAATATEFAAQAPVLVEAGAAFIGGCCGTGPDFIRALRAQLRIDR